MVPVSEFNEHTTSPCAITNLLGMLVMTTVKEKSRNLADIILMYVSITFSMEMGL